MNKEEILVVGQWAEGLQTVTSLLKKEAVSYVVNPFSSFKEVLNNSRFDLVIFCLSKLEFLDINLIADIRQDHDAIPILVVSDQDNWEVIVSAMKAGANDYLKIPFTREKFKKALYSLLKMYYLTRRVFFLDDQFKLTNPFEGMIGVSEGMQENFRMIRAVAKANATVLITGESGTGKELVAKALHRQSNRSNGRFVDLNCGAIPRDLLENELFGHEKGAFTGAHKRYCGSFEAAHKGTLFLDEISEMDPLLQVKLLRVLQERSFMRIGGTEKIDVDVRIIAATNRNLQELISTGQFREDLFYRLNVVNIGIPSLRERRADIPLLASHFLEYYSAKNNRIFLDFAQEAMEALINYDWPGNVRELENTIERIVVLHDDSRVKLKFLPKAVQSVHRAISMEAVLPAMAAENRVIPLDDLERKAIEMALMKFQGNISVAAKKLKIGQATLYRKVKKYGLYDAGKLSS